MDFLSKLLHMKPPAQSGSGRSPGTNATETLPAKDQDTYVNFAREFIEEIVENIPPSRANSTFTSAQLEAEDKSNLSSAFSEFSLLSNLSTSSFEASLPDLLQPESVYKKQADTDTDTTDYESAVDSDHQDTVSLGASVIESTNNSSFFLQDTLGAVGEQTLNASVLDATYVSEAVGSTSCSFQDTWNGSATDGEVTPSEDFEDAENSVDQSYAEPTLNISELCHGIGKLCLETPKANKLEKPAYVDGVLSPEFLVTLKCDVSDTSFEENHEESVRADSHVEVDLSKEALVEQSCNGTFASDLLESSNAESLTTDEINVTVKLVDSELVEVFEKQAEEVLPVEAFTLEKQAENIILCEALEKQVEEIVPVVTPEKQFEEAVPVEAHEKHAGEIVPVATLEKQTEVAVKILQKLAEEIVPVETLEQLAEEIVPVDTFEKQTVVPVETLEKLAEEIVPVETLEKQADEIVPVETLEKLSKEIVPVETLEKLAEEIVPVETSKKLAEEIVPVETLEKLSEEIVPVETLEKLTEEIVPVETCEKLAEETVPVETLEKQAEEIVPVETLENLSEEIVPVETIKKEVEEVVPVESLEKQAEEIVPVETLEKQAEEIVPVETIKKEVEEVVPVESLEKQAEEIVPVETLEKQAEEIVPAETLEKQVEEVLSVETLKKEVEDIVPGEALEKQAEDIIPAGTTVEEIVPVETVAQLSQEHLSPVDVEICVSAAAEVKLETDTEQSLPKPEKCDSEKEQSTETTPLLLGEACLTQSEQSLSEQSLSEQVSRLTLQPLDCSSVVASPSAPSVVTPHRLCHGDGSHSSISPSPTVVDSKIGLLGGDDLSSGSSLHSLLETCRRQQERLDRDVQRPLDFSDVAAEAAKVSADIHNASQEIDEADLMATRGGDESAVPLDVKWRSDGGVGATQTPPPKSKFTATAAVKAEDPFSTKSRLSNTPPRDVDLSAGGDNKGSCDAVNAADLNQSEAGPEIAQQTNADANEMFADSAGFDFLSKMGNSEPSRRLGLESLYVKFDPLVSAAPVANTTDRNIPLPPKFHETHNAAAPAAIASDETADLPPPYSEDPPQHLSSPRPNPAIALVDRLISLSPSPRKPLAPRAPAVPPPVAKQEIVTPAKIVAAPNQDEMNEELLILRELLDRQDAAHEDTLSKLSADQKALEYQVSGLQLTLKQAEEREQALLRRTAESAQARQNMQLVMVEYEKTIASMLAEKERNLKDFEADKLVLVKEKDIALGHLTNIEIAFSDVHQKYERIKIVVEGYKTNEEVLRESLASHEAKIRQQEQKYDMLKSHAMQQLESANHELDAVRRSQQTEAAKYRAMLKKSELKVSSLEEMLEQKQKENRELTSICDDLIAKVGD